jgi:diguanylate cyclase (GGDEF)-like protein
MRRGWLGFFILFLLLAAPHASRAGVPIVLDPNVGRINLAPWIDVLEDPDGGLNMDQAASVAVAERFKPHRQDEFNVGHSRSAFWFRFKLTPPPEGMNGVEWFIEFGKPGLNLIDLYVPLADGSWRVLASGANRPQENRDVMHRSFVFGLPGGFDQDRFFYARVQSSISLNFSLLLWRPAEYSWWVIFDYYGFGVVYGVMIAMLIYNLAIFAFLSDRTYLYYVLYILAALVLLSMTYGHLPLFIRLTDGKEVMIIWPVAGFLWVAAGAFTRAFLNTRVIAPVLDKTVLVFMALGGLLILVGLSGQNHVSNLFNTAMTIICSALAITVGLACWIRGFKPAKFYLLAWIILIAGGVLYVLGGVVIPRTFITRYTLAMGAPLESLILSLALAARIKVLREENEEFRSRADELKELSQTDGLTGLFNKRYLMERLQLDVDRAAASGRPLSLVMMDVDDFKQFNDKHGHLAGDDVLRRLARVLTNSARGGDWSCQYGGEEFVLTLPGADPANGFEVAERVRKAFAKETFPAEDGTMASVSISLGLAGLKAGDTVTALIHRADQALYQAKYKGKNQTVAAG